MSSDKYFYKLALLISDWENSEINNLFNEISPSIVSKASSINEDQIEEWSGLTDLDGKPFNRNRKIEIEDVSSNPEKESMFPLDTMDGDKISEKGFRRWVRREMKDYINALIENYEWKYGVGEDNSIYDYVSRKGWVDFVNKFNPLRFIVVDLGNNVKKLSNEFEKQTGRSLKKEYMNSVKRLVNKKKKNSMTDFEQSTRMSSIKRRLENLIK